MSNALFESRRIKFFIELEKLAENSVAIVSAHPEIIRNHDVHFKFRQDSNFHYLTGFDEPESIAVFRSVGGKKEFILFVRPKDLAKEIWTGYRAGVDGALSKYKATSAYPISEFEQQFNKIISGADRVYYSFFKTQNLSGATLLDAKILQLLDQYRQSKGRSGAGMLPIFDVNAILGEMRIFKSQDEIEYMRKASQITAKAHKEVMSRVRPGLNEFQIEALLEFIFRDSGCERHGYPSIVASGSNATILHYVENNQVLKSDELLLVDAGGEYEYYTSDITRTFSISGRMTEPQKEIYNIVLDIQKECIKMARPGVTLTKIHDFAVSELTQAMISLGFLNGDKKTLIDNQAFKKFYPHGTGHLLGMDVHDIGLYQINGEPRKLEPSMAFTVEPGFYVLPSEQIVPSKYLGIGIRIEDDIVITKDGCEVLTSGVPKDIDEMQALHGSKPWLDLN